MTNDCICSNVPRIWRLAGVTRTVRLTVTKDGSPYDFTGLQTVLRIDRDNSDFHYEPQFTVEGDDNNIIVFTWAADKQPLGDYTIEVAVTDGSGNMDRVNWHGATGVRLVEYSNLVKGEDAAGVESDSELGLDGIFTMNGTGMSAFDEWLASDESQGYPQTMDGYMQWQQHAAMEAAAEVLAELGSRDGSAAGDGTMWGDYKSAEAQRNTDYGTAEEHRDGEYATAEAARDTRYGTAEGTSGSAAGNGSRWGAYKTAENSRDGEYSSAEGHRDSEYSSAEGHRDGEYATAEAARDTLYGQAEGTASSAAGSNNRWGSYKTAEAARNTARETAEGTAASSAGDGTRWGAYKTAEAARNTARENAEGTASSTAGDGTRWGAYKTAEAARGTAYGTAEGTSSSTAGDGSRWGAYKTAEAARSEQLNDLEAEVTQLGQNITNLQQEIDSIQPIVIEGNVTNAPDEEDITTDENDLLKLANRPTAVNQMGYVILRKNKTFAEQLTMTHTIYEIRYEFDLGGASVTIPAGCVLKFNGGKLTNGTIIGQDTGIDSGIVKIFDSISFSGTWNVGESYPEWFGAKGDGTTDDTLPIRAVCASPFKTIVFARKTYVVGTYSVEWIDTTTINSAVKLNGVAGKKFVGNATTLKAINTSSSALQYSILCFDGCSNIEVSGINFYDGGYNFNTNLNICAGIHCIKDNFVFNIDIQGDNIRYPFRSGYFGNDTINGTNGLVSSSVKVRSGSVGYPISIDHGSSNTLNVYTENCHRALYLASCDNTSAKVSYIANKSAGNNVALTESIASKGCSGISLDIEDRGTTVYSAVLSIIPQDLISHTDNIVFENIKANIKLQPGANCQSFSFVNTTASVNVVVRNFELEIDDKSGITSFASFSTQGIKENYVVTGCKVKINTPKPLYLGNNKSSSLDFYLKDSNTGIISFAASSKTNKYVLDNVTSRNTTCSTTTETIHLHRPLLDGIYNLFENASHYTFFGRTHGATTDRPLYPNKGYMFWDETLNKPIWYKEYGVWVDATGVTV